jgi:hypothetical protein
MVPIWISDEQRPRPTMRQNRGRRASDRRPSLETMLGAVSLLAWAWCGYELLRLFTH